ncbi:MAG: phosphoglycerate/bisphosphoglycerate mutase [Alphaproteobacteria bacterium]|nr:phosphoglycerate/bisphosphoglycerate mutase [Alphaproteobacteria bacterium]
MVFPIYLMRHGETEWNTQGRIQGALDSPLTERGRQQAQTMGLALKRELGRAAPPLYCSPLGRARQTLEIVCATAGLDAGSCVFDERLREVSWGEWDGMTRAEIEASTPGALAERRASHWTHMPPGGSSYAQLAERLQPFVGAIKATGGIVIGHGATTRVLRGLHLGLPPHDIVRLEEPQDKVFGLYSGRIETF